MPKKKYPKITKKDLKEGVKKWKEENEEYIDCSRCESMIRELFANPLENKEAREAFMKDPSKLQCNVCNGKRKIKVPKYWEEEFEGELITDHEELIFTGSEEGLVDILKYIGIDYNYIDEHAKVKIKARKGEIVIKRVEE